MNNRERLIEILSRKVHPRDGVDPAVVVADFLLNNDILPVVRCRGCKWDRPDILLDKHWCSCFFTEVREDDFCSHGKRMEDEPR